MRTALIGIGFVILIAIGYYAFTHTQMFQAANSAPSAQAVRVTPVEIKETTSRYTIDATYPQFGIATIDTQIKKDVDDAVTEIEGYPANPPDMASPQNELTISYENPYIGPDIVSVR